MAGKVRGVAARITAKYPKAIYIHCAVHRLNLYIVKCCQIPEVSNVMKVADQIARYFNNSPKRQLALETWIDDVLQGEKKKEMCRTRWVERHQAFEVFSDLYMPLVCCLESISRSTLAEWNKDSIDDARSHLSSLSQFSFIVGLQATQAVFSYTKGLSVKLQGRYTDITRAHHEIEMVKSAVKDARANIRRFFSS